MMTTAATVAHIIAEQAGRDVGAVTPDKRLVADLLLDSLERIELVMALEEHFDLVIDAAAAEACVTVGDCVALVERLLPTPACARDGNVRANLTKGAADD